MLDWTGVTEPGKVNKGQGQGSVGLDEGSLNLVK